MTGRLLVSGESEGDLQLLRSTPYAPVGPENGSRSRVIVRRPAPPHVHPPKRHTDNVDWSQKRTAHKARIAARARKGRQTEALPRGSLSSAKGRQSRRDAEEISRRQPTLPRKRGPRRTSPLVGPNVYWLVDPRWAPSGANTQKATAASVLATPHAQRRGDALALNADTM